MGFVDINKLCCHYAIYWTADPENTSVIFKSKD